MTNRENLIASLEGRKPERIPFTTYANFGFPKEELDGLIALGFAQAEYASVVREESPDVERLVRKAWVNGREVETVVLKTSAGELSQTSADGWIQSYFLKSPADYRIMAEIVRRTKLTADYGAFARCEEAVGESGITLLALPRSPMQTILVDYAGLEQLAYHMAEDMDAIWPLYEALQDRLLEVAHIIARGPGRYVHMTENMTAETWGGARFRRFHRPVYEAILPVLHAGGKKLYVHYDGKLRAVAQEVREVAVDGIESFTVPPEGDMDYAEIRQALPDTYIWSNISLSAYNLEDCELEHWVRRAVSECAPDGRNFALAILEDIPSNWRQKVPVVLEALRRG